MAITFKIQVDLGSVRELDQMFEGVKNSVRNRILKQSMGKVARRTAKVAKERAPKGPSGTLKKSMGTRYRSYQKGLVWVYAIGPRRGFKGFAPHQPKRRYDFVPTKYAHLAERGRGPLVAKNYPKMLFYPTATATARIARYKVGPARGFRFMEKAYKMLESPSARFARFLIEDIKASIDRQAEKYASRGKSIYA